MRERGVRVKRVKLPGWAEEVIDRYESGSAGCFVLHGNINDRLLLPLKGGARLGSLTDFLQDVLLERFDVVLSYDLGQGVRVERGGDVFSRWPSLSDGGDYPWQPLEAARFLNHYLTYLRNLNRVKLARGVDTEVPRVAVVVRQAQLVCPSIPNALNYDLHALASLWRGWASEAPLCENGQAVFLLSENMNGLHPLVANCPQLSTLEVPLPSVEELGGVIELLGESCPIGLGENVPGEAASRLRGATVSAVESLLKRREYDGAPLEESDLGDLKKELVERECEGLIGFVEPDRSLDDVIGLDGVKRWLKQDLDLWRRDELEAMPMGYLFCGPVGTGKTYLAECLAGEAGVPVVTLKNFRSKWVGSTEANLEKIFSLLHALGRCMVFIDEADQALGKRAGGGGDSGVSSRVYSMMAKEMSNTRNRGKLVWILASSRPDLIEVDLKRPGRIDVKIPIFPSVEREEALRLFRALARRRGLKMPEEEWTKLSGYLPELLTPGGAEALAVKALRLVKAEGLGAYDAVSQILRTSEPPVSPAVIQAQMRLAAAESTESGFVPEAVKRFL